MKSKIHLQIHQENEKKKFINEHPRERERENGTVLPVMLQMGESTWRADGCSCAMLPTAV